MTTVRILRPSLDDLRPRQTVLRGIVHNDDLQHLRNDFYQRELLQESQRREIMVALDSASQLPDIELGMRGDRFQVNTENEVILLDPVFIIDGRQRVGTTLKYLAERANPRVHIGAIVHFNTNVDWERARFQVLNTARVKVSPSLLLRNIKDNCAPLAMLYGLSMADSTFPLYRRVTWKQNPARDDMLSAVAFVRVALRMHSHLIPSRQSIAVSNVTGLLGRLEQRIGMAMIRANVTALWKLIDDVWGIRGNSIRAELPHVRSGFLDVFSDILADHVDFWGQPDEVRFGTPYELKNKLAKFPIFDPEIVRLASSAGKAREALYFILLTHINSGKRTKRLVPRNARATIPSLVDGDQDDEETAA